MNQFKTLEMLPPTVDCSIATASAKHTTGVPHTGRKSNVSNKLTGKYIQTLHTDLECSTAQFTLKSISAGLTNQREPKNEEKNGNSLNASLFTSALFRIQLPSSCE